MARKVLTPGRPARAYSQPVQTLAVPWNDTTVLVDVDETAIDAAELQAELTTALAGGRDRHDLYQRLDAVAERHDLAYRHVIPSPHEWHFALEQRERWPGSA